MSATAAMAPFFVPTSLFYLPILWNQYYAPGFDFNRITQAAPWRPIVLLTQNYFPQPCIETLIYYSSVLILLLGALGWKIGKKRTCYQLRSSMGA